MKGHRYKRKGWFGESQRHYLASKGVKTGRRNDMNSGIFGSAMGLFAKKAKSVVLDNPPKETIGTVQGEAKYVRTEIEDDQGNWNDNYYTRDGFYVIHRGDKHHVYEVM